MDHEEQIVQTVEQVMPGVVSIVVGKDYEDLMRERPYELVVPHGDHFDRVAEEELPHTKGGKIRVGGGSGFIVDSAGLVLTNKHVVHDPDAEYMVTTASEETYPGRVVARDPLNDVAVLRIESHDPVTAIPLGNSDRIRLGQTVLAVGTALGEFQNTVSSGIISGLSRFITAMTDLEGHSERLRGLIQTDAAINPGNSGGPLVNVRGEVVGINTAVAFGAQNIGFAIPINKAKRDLAELKKHGRIRRPFLGVRYVMLDSLIQKKFRTSVDRGALVLREGVPERPAVISHSPADRAGLREGDIILALNNQEISEAAKKGIEDILEEVELGSQIPVKILRDGREHTLTVMAEERR